MLISGSNPFRSILQQILELQSNYSSSNTSAMQERGELVRTKAVGLILSFLKESNNSYLFEAEGRDGTGKKSKVPWVRIYQSQFSKTARTGYYLVYLFAADGSAVYLSLNQGVTQISEDEIDQLRDIARNILKKDIGQIANGQLDILLKSDVLGTSYERGNIIAKQYKRNEIPADEQLIIDVHLMLNMLSHLYTNPNNSVQSSNTIDASTAPDPLHIVLEWIARLNTQLSPNGHFYYKPMMLLAVLDLIDQQHPAQNRFLYEELYAQFQTNAHKLGTSITESQFSQPYIRLCNDLKPIPVWSLDVIDGYNPPDTHVETLQVIRKSVPSIHINPQVWPAFLSLESRMALREDLLKKWPTTCHTKYSLSDLGIDIGQEKKVIEGWLRAIDRKKQAILYGPPGTGKTFVARALAKYLVSSGDGLIELVQFHPSYSYEDFIEGIRPKVGENNSLHFNTVKGRFLVFCEQANKRTDTCILIIDEINRANLSKVFGELMYLLEYRNEQVSLSGGSTFHIPENVRIIGTMNTADRSIALVDHALRRRFSFLHLRPNYDVLRRFHEDTLFNPTQLISVLERLNKQIDDPHYEIGISFFLIKNLESTIEDIWTQEIEPYLEEYFFDQMEKVDLFRWDRIQKEVLG